MGLCVFKTLTLDLVLFNTALTVVSEESMECLWELAYPTEHGMVQVQTVTVDTQVSCSESCDLMVHVFLIWNSSRWNYHYKRQSFGQGCSNSHANSDIMYSSAIDCYCYSKFYCGNSHLSLE